jgi:FkbH-like protein
MSLPMSGAPVLALACSFTDRLVLEGMDRELAGQQVRVRTRAAPYGQVAETLLAPAGAAGTGQPCDHVVVLFRPDDALRGTDAQGDPQYRWSDRADAQVEVLAEGLARQLAWGHEVLLCLPPSGDPVRQDPQLSRWAERTPRRLAAAAEATGARMALIPEGGAWDPRLDSLAHIPYRPAWLRGLSGSLARAVFPSVSRPLKVLALDCDDTLWGGACGELGVGGIDTGHVWERIQQFVRRQAGDGRLVCLVSHNQAQDVYDVLDSGRCGLTRSDVAAARIDWRPKPVLLEELVGELNLAADSFLFLDDNPGHRAAVRSALPQMLVPEFASPDQLLQLLENLWQLQSVAGTAEDRHRTQRYQEERDRRSLAERIGDHERFLRELRLEVDISALEAADLPRARQLLGRVTQFRSVAIGFAAEELQAGAASPDTRIDCWRVEVRDRLGDYGFVGLLALAPPAGEVLAVRALLLSCRALGRGVEEAVLTHLNRLARERDCSRIRFRTPVTDRNEPLRALLTRLGAGQAAESDGVFELELEVDGR